MRTQAQIQADIDAAYGYDLTLRMASDAYKANRLQIGELRRELQAAYLAETRPMTEAEMLREYDIPDAEQAQREKQGRQRVPVLSMTPGGPSIKCESCGNVVCEEHAVGKFCTECAAERKAASLDSAA